MLERKAVATLLAARACGTVVSAGADAPFEIEGASLLHEGREAETAKRHWTAAQPAGMPGAALQGECAAAGAANDKASATTQAFARRNAATNRRPAGPQDGS